MLTYPRFTHHTHARVQRLLQLLSWFEYTIYYRHKTPLRHCGSAASVIDSTQQSHAICETSETRLTRESVQCSVHSLNHNDDGWGTWDWDSSSSCEMLGLQYPSLIGRVPKCTSPVPDEDLRVVKWMLRSCLSRTSNSTGSPLSMNGHETLMFGRGSRIVSIMTHNSSFNSRPRSDGSSSQPAVWPQKAYARCERRNIAVRNNGWRALQTVTPLIMIYNHCRVHALAASQTAESCSSSKNLFNLSCFK